MQQNEGQRPEGDDQVPAAEPVDTKAAVQEGGEVYEEAGFSDDPDQADLRQALEEQEDPPGPGHYMQDEDEANTPGDFASADDIPGEYVEVARQDVPPEQTYRSPNVNVDDDEDGDLL